MRYWRRISLHSIQFISVLILASIPYFLGLGQSYALDLSDRSVTISTATPSAIASHTFNMTIHSDSPIGSIVFEYCSNSPLIYDTCTAPNGLSASGAMLEQQSGNTGFSIDSADSSANKIVITRPAVVPNLVQSSFRFTNITNPSVNNQTTFVRISTYGSVDGSGSYIDNGSVAFSTENNYIIGAYVPPFLSLCVGVTVAPDCSQQSGFSLNLGVLSSQATSSITSQFAASTNDVSGYDVFMIGSTMTSGNNIIPENDTPAVSRVGSSEFGVNLRHNTNPSIGADPSGPGTAIPTGSYNVPNLFNFSSGDEIAYSTMSTAYTRMTVSYIVNVNNSQPPGIYSTTLTYLASAQF